MSSNDQLIHAAAGAAGGVVAMTLTYPLIFLSTRAAVDIKREDKSTYQAVLDVIQSEGLRGLYSGLNSSLLGIAVTNGVYYFFYEKSRAALLSSSPRKGGALTTLESMLAGLLAGSATTITSNPLWVIQTTQAVRTLPSTSAPSQVPEPQGPKKKLGFLATVRYILRTDGLAAFWRGIGPALVLVVNPILQYTVFEQLKNALIARRLVKLRAAKSTLVPALSGLDYFLLGALSKLVATTLTYPYIVIKSRMQSGHAHTREYKSSWDGLTKIVQREGIAGLYRGIGSKLAQSVLTAAILFAGQRRFYEMTKSALITYGPKPRK
ncbi:peroxisomal membrane protein [Ceratobasidium sp. AG-I]|nr:peroxisomal membrane protein [Ceratobasidium sp. AG-I]